MFKRGQGRPSRPNGTRPKGTGEWPQPRRAARLPERAGEERDREAKREQEKRKEGAPQRHTKHTHTTHTPHAHLGAKPNNKTNNESQNKFKTNSEQGKVAKVQADTKSKSHLGTNW